MLRELRVENMLLIERAELRLSPGLNVLTGETGAGKTVLAHALDLLLGGRARPGIVRPGAAEAYVEGVFDLSGELRERLGERIAPDSSDLVLARRVGGDGRTRAYLAGRAATVGELRDVGASLLAFYGQHEHRKLTVASSQLQILDGVCEGDHAARLHGCAQAHARVRALQERRRALVELAGERERELDLLEYELAEIDEAAPDEGEHQRLLAARERMRMRDALLGAAAAGLAALAPEASERSHPEGHRQEGSPGAAALAAAALAQMQTHAGVDPGLDALAGRMGSLVIETRDLAGELRAYLERDGALPAEESTSAPDARAEGAEPALEALEERLTRLDRLARKHGGSIAAVLAFAEQARARHAELAGAEEALQSSGVELARAIAELDACALGLRAARTAAASTFASAVGEQLAELAMAGASFEVALGEREPGPCGADTVEFLIAPNPGVPAAPVREIASGGELSRVMLAVMSVAGAASPGGTLVFDEVDAGVGGQTARAVGARLRALAGSRQVLCITHLPQIASLAERHFSIVKDTSADPTRTSVVQLRERDVVSELVRMLGADSDDANARRHARELRRAA